MKNESIDKNTIDQFLPGDLCRGSAATTKISICFFTSLLVKGRWHREIDAHLISNKETYLVLGMNITNDTLGFVLVLTDKGLQFSAARYLERATT